MALLPEPEELSGDITREQRARLENWDRLMPIREQVLKSLETAREEKFIGASLQARVRLQANGDLYALLRDYAPELPGLFITSQVAVEEGPEFTVTVEKADGEKCERCWKYLPEVGRDPEYPTICRACRDAIKELPGE
jgi:isoleucyl-tRNA synthetase